MLSVLMGVSGPSRLPAMASVLLNGVSMHCSCAENIKALDAERKGAVWQSQV